MNINNFFKGKAFDQPLKVVKPSSVTSPEPSRKPSNNFSFLVFACVTAAILGAVGTLDWLIDPLWYGGANRLTGKNFPFNERISKTNLFLNTDVKDYDCLILGSSRVTALNSSEFKEHKCFNYSFKGGWANDFINVAEFVKKQGFNPKIIYVGVDEFNFVKQQDVAGKAEDFGSYATQSPYHAYLSSNVLMFSVMTLAGSSPDPFNYYNENFEAVEFPEHPEYEAAFYPAEPPQECDLSRVERYQKIKEIFPDARIVGYVPPRSSWALVNETYNRNLMDCALEGFYQVSQIYDDMYDFSVPSDITLDPGNTYDGSHFTPQANAKVAAVLEGRDTGLALHVDELNLNTYKETFKSELKEFLEKEGQESLWRG
ncbi:MAG TPA: hypothetical protein V6D06_16525 [Trichocoleus sp.]